MCQLHGNRRSATGRAVSRVACHRVIAHLCNLKASRQVFILVFHIVQCLPASTRDGHPSSGGHAIPLAPSNSLTYSYPLCLSNLQFLPRFFLTFLPHYHQSSGPCPWKPALNWNDLSPWFVTCAKKLQLTSSSLACDMRNFSHLSQTKDKDRSS